MSHRCAAVVAQCQAPLQHVHQLVQITSLTSSRKLSSQGGVNNRKPQHQQYMTTQKEDVGTSEGVCRTAQDQLQYQQQQHTASPAWHAQPVDNVQLKRLVRYGVEK
jgi:hypothetical protein